MLLILQLILLIACADSSEDAVDQAAPAQTVRPVTAAEFDRAIATGLVLVDFWSEDCPPCIAMKPDLQAFAADHRDQVTVISVHAFDESTVTMAHDVAILPTLVLFRDGKELRRREGRLDRQQLQDLIADPP